MIRYQKAGKQMTVYLDGEIDHCFAEQARNEIDRLLTDSAIERLLFDFSSATFIDSSGVGLIIGRYKKMASRGGRVFARKMSPGISRLFRLAGLHRIITIEEAGGKTEHE